MHQYDITIYYFHVNIFAVDTVDGPIPRQYDMWFLSDVSLDVFAPTVYLSGFHTVYLSYMPSDATNYSRTSL